MKFPDAPDSNFRAGYVAIVGLPNAGKSTLLNAMVGQKVSIVTPKAQTTRHRIAGFYTDEKMQIVFLDTPGILEPRYGLHKSMMKAVERSLGEADLIVLLIDPLQVPSDEMLKRFLPDDRRLIVVVNKADITKQIRMEDIVEILTKTGFSNIQVISALTQFGVDGLKERLCSKLPLGWAMYPEDQLSEHPERFFFAEFIREQVFLQTREEIPYSVAVEILSVDETRKMPEIQAEIICERETQKGILIGHKGSTLKSIGIESRKTIEEFMGKPVVLKLFIKVRSDWRNSSGFLKSFGYE